MTANKNLYPGGSSQAGFLLNNQTLGGIIARDKKAMELMGVNKEYILSLLDHLIEGLNSIKISNKEKTKELLSKYTREELKSNGMLIQLRQNNIYTAPNGKQYYISEGISCQGVQECPLCPGNYPYGNYTTKHGIELIGGLTSVKITDKDNRTLLIADLLPHLIKEHNFFEGGPYRTSPEEIIEWLGKENTTNGINKAKELILF